jgi:type II secretory pathway pseudopilin PulG
VKPSYRQEQEVEEPRHSTLKELVVILVILGALLALILPSILNAREAARAAQCRGHMSQLKLAVEIYRDTNGRFPPAVFLDEASKAEHSWRVLILPYFANSSLDDYHWDESWNSQQNSSLFPRSESQMFQCPSGANVRTEFTNYVCVRGRETMFPKGKSINLDDVADGAENTIVLVEAHGLDIHWREPRDLEFSTMSLEINNDSIPSINSPHPGGPVVSFADTSYRQLADTITGADVRALLTRAAGDSPKQAELDKDDGTFGR